jgi:BRCT domain type II-containing protein
MVFLITGILDSLERDEATKLIESHGGYINNNNNNII